jgi:N-acylneuraminate cytidylyltransferase
LRLFAERGADSLVGVHKIHPFIWQNPEAPTASYDYLKRPRRQDVSADDEMYEETGALYIMKASWLRQSGNRLGGKIVLFPMESDESWDVDTEADLDVVDALLSRKMA